MLLLPFLFLAIALTPAAVAIGGIGVPEQKALFAAAALIGASVATGWAYRNRRRTWELSTLDRGKRVLIVAGISGGLLLGYLIVYKACVLDSAQANSRVFLPLWLSGRAEAMVEKAGTRHRAVDMYDFEELTEASRELPNVSTSVTLACLVLLFVYPLSTLTGVAADLGLRRPTGVFSPSARLGELFDVFLCCDEADQFVVRGISRYFAERRIRFFLDADDIDPDNVRARHVEAALRVAPVIIHFVGQAGIGRSQAEKIQMSSEQRILGTCRMIVVLLPGLPARFQMPSQLAGLTAVDLRKTHTDAIALLLRETGCKPENSAAATA